MPHRSVIGRREGIDAMTRTSVQGLITDGMARYTTSVGVGL